MWWHYVGVKEKGPTGLALLEIWNYKIFWLPRIQIIKFHPEQNKTAVSQSWKASIVHLVFGHFEQIMTRCTSF